MRVQFIVAVFRHGFRLKLVPKFQSVSCYFNIILTFCFCGFRSRTAHLIFNVSCCCCTVLYWAAYIRTSGVRGVPVMRSACACRSLVVRLTSTPVLLRSLLLLLLCQAFSRWAVGPPRAARALASAHHPARLSMRPLGDDVAMKE